MSTADDQPGPAPETGPVPETCPPPETASAAAAEGEVVPASESAPPAPDDPIYVSKREVRKNAGKGTSKKSMYFLEFYLVDNHGYETLAATGEDQGAIPTALCHPLRHLRMRFVFLPYRHPSDICDGRCLTQGWCASVQQRPCMSRPLT